MDVNNYCAIVVRLVFILIVVAVSIKVLCILKSRDSFFTVTLASFFLSTLSILIFDTPVLEKYKTVQTLLFMSYFLFNAIAHLFFTAQYV